jgi:hypothetical protein
MTNGKPAAPRYDYDESTVTDAIAMLRDAFPIGKEAIAETWAIIASLSDPDRTEIWQRLSELEQRTISQQEAA